jgi:magnesium and cobalt transporter
MSDLPAGAPRKKARPLLERLAAFLSGGPENRDDLLEVLRQSRERNLLDADALSMIEGVLQVSELSARDIMLPRAQMDVINISQSPDEFIPRVIATAHSRFPVVEDERDNVIGILHAKDLLKFYAERDFDVRAMLRPAVFIPESKRLNILLHDFKLNRNHIAIVVDEYGGVAGMITIEDVLEQIVGDIEDEFDFDEADDHIVEMERNLLGSRYRVKAITEISQFNEYFKTNLSAEQYDTVGGLVTEQFGRVPRRGEAVEMAGLRFEVLRTDERQLQILSVEPVKSHASKIDQDD